nr:class I SAM-dependent methyltransferase [Gordonia namibiensis]
MVVETGIGDLRSRPWLKASVDAFVDTVRGLGPVLDVGCGPGTVTAYLAEAGLDVTGVDLSPAWSRTRGGSRALSPGGHLITGTHVGDEDVRRTEAWVKTSTASGGRVMLTTRGPTTTSNGRRRSSTGGSAPEFADRTADGSGQSVRGIDRAGPGPCRSAGRYRPGCGSPKSRRAGFRGVRVDKVMPCLSVAGPQRTRPVPPQVARRIRFLTCANPIGRVDRRCPAHAGPVRMPGQRLSSRP